MHNYLRKCRRRVEAEIFVGVNVMKVIAKKIINSIYTKLVLKIKCSNVRIIDSYISFDTIFEGFNVVNAKSVLINSYVGKYSYIGSDCHLLKTKIGRFCSIGSEIRIIAGNHPTSRHVSTHPAFFSCLKQSGITFVRDNKYEEYSYSDENRKFFVSIGSDVWIGNNVLILNGVNIGDGAIVAAGSVVVKDVPSYTIAGGVPAKQLRMRFPDDDVQFLENLRWWEKSDDWLRKNSSLFDDIKKLRAKHEK